MTGTPEARGQRLLDALIASGYVVERLQKMPKIAFLDAFSYLRFRDGKPRTSEAARIAGISPAQAHQWRHRDAELRRVCDLIVDGVAPEAAPPIIEPVTPTEALARAREAALRIERSLNPEFTPAFPAIWPIARYSIEDYHRLTRGYLNLGELLDGEKADDGEPILDEKQVQQLTHDLFVAFGEDWATDLPILVWAERTLHRDHKPEHLTRGLEDVGPRTQLARPRPMLYGRRARGAGREHPCTDRLPLNPPLHRNHPLLLLGE